MFSCKLLELGTDRYPRQSVTMFNRLGCGNASAVVKQPQPQAGGADGNQQAAREAASSPASASPSPAPSPRAVPPPFPPLVAPAQGAAPDGAPQAALPVAAAIGYTPASAPATPPPALVAPAHGAGPAAPPPLVPGLPPPLVVPQFQQDIPGLSPQDRNGVNQLLRVVFDLIEQNGVPRSLSSMFQPGGGGVGPPPAQRRRLNNDGGGGPPPNPFLTQAAQAAMSERTPMIMDALLRNLWPGGSSYQHAPDAWIFLRLWNIIRQYDATGRIMTFHLNCDHELPGAQQNTSHFLTAYACDCWAQRLGRGWDSRTGAQELAMLPPGIILEPPDKLKRILTAVLDDYVKIKTDSFRRNPWIHNKRQPYFWALWMMPFVKSFLQLQGLDKFTNGQYWYLLDEDATVLGQLTGYEMEHIHTALIRWRRAVQPPPTPPPSPPVPAPPPPGPLRKRARGNPDDYFLIDQFLLPHYLRDNTFTPKTIDKEQRESLWKRTETMQKLLPDRKSDQLNSWNKPRHRGHKLIRVGQDHYDSRADQHNAPHLDQCWAGKAVINEQWLQEALRAAIQEADKIRRHALHHDAIKAIYKAARRGPQNVQQAPAATQHNLAGTPQDGVFVPLGPPLTLEEIYLIATAISETQHANQLHSNAIQLIIQELRAPVVSARIRQMIRLTAYHPPNASQQDMKFDLWGFELGAPPGPRPGPPSPLWVNETPVSPRPVYPVNQIPPAPVWVTQPPPLPHFPPINLGPSPPQAYQIPLNPPSQQNRSPSPPCNYQSPSPHSPLENQNPSRSPLGSNQPRSLNSPQKNRRPSPPSNYQSPSPHSLSQNQNPSTFPNSPPLNYQPLSPNSPPQNQISSPQSNYQLPSPHSPPQNRSPSPSPPCNYQPLSPNSPPQNQSLSPQSTYQLPSPHSSPQNRSPSRSPPCNLQPLSPHSPSQNQNPPSSPSGNYQSSLPYSPPQNQSLSPPPSSPLHDDYTWVLSLFAQDSSNSPTLSPHFILQNQSPSPPYNYQISSPHSPPQNYLTPSPSPPPQDYYTWIQSLLAQDSSNSQMSSPHSPPQNQSPSPSCNYQTSSPTSTQNSNVNPQQSQIPDVVNPDVTAQLRDRQRLIEVTRTRNTTMQATSRQQSVESQQARRERLLQMARNHQANRSS